MFSVALFVLDWGVKRPDGLGAIYSGSGQKQPALIDRLQAGGKRPHSSRAEFPHYYAATGGPCYADRMLRLTQDLFVLWERDRPRVTI